MKLFAAFIFTSTLLFAQEPQDADLPIFHTLVLASDEQSLLNPENLASTSGIIAAGVEVPGGIEQLEKQLATFFNTPITSENIIAIKKEIQLYYEKQELPLVVIHVPQQNISQGSLQFVLSMSRLSDLEIKGNRWTSNDVLRNYFEIAPGDTINEQILRRDLEFMNRNPFRHVNAILSPGKSPDTTGITLSVKERNPYRIYGGVDNTGVPITDRQRYYAGFNYAKMFGLDHVFSFQFTAAPNARLFQAYTVQYQAYLPWRHVLNVYGGYSSVHADLDFPVTKTHGTSSQGSLRYTIPFNPGPSFTHEISVGFDYKRTNNTLEFSDLFVNFTKNVNLTQVMGEYRCEKTFKICLIDLLTQVFYSPGKWLPEQTNSDYSALRPHAKNAYAYTRTDLNFLFYLPHSFYWNFLFQGQVSTQNLLPSEQFGIGGYNTVRGYDERQLNVDDAVLASMEIRSPYLPVFPFKKNKNAIQFLLFTDFGWGTNYEPIPNEKTPQYLFSAGPGMRYTLDPYFTARLDWGIKLHKNSEFTGGNSMLQFSCTLSY